MKHESFNIITAELEYLRFTVVKPHEGVGVLLAYKRRSTDLDIRRPVATIPYVQL
jgi:hypothetical protein